MASRKDRRIVPFGRPTRRFDIGAAFVSGLGLDVPTVEHELGELIDEVCDLSGRGSALGLPAGDMRKFEALRHAFYVIEQALRDARAVHDEEEQSSLAAQRLKRMYSALPKERKYEQPGSEVRQARFGELVSGAIDYARDNLNGESSTQLAEVSRNAFSSLDKRFRTLELTEITRVLAENSPRKAAAILLIKAKAFSAAKLKGKVDKANVAKIIDALKKAEKRAAQQIEKRKVMVRGDIERRGL